MDAGLEAVSCSGHIIWLTGSQIYSEITWPQKLKDHRSLYACE